MPLSPIQKKELIRNAGLDPANHYMDEATGDVFEGSDPNEIAAPELPSDVPPAPRPDTSSATKVFVKSALENALPTGASMLSGVAAANAIPASWVGGPWTKAAATLGGALAGGMAGSAAQRALVPQPIQDTLFPSALEREEYPKASLIGDIAGGSPFLNPIKGIQSLIRGGGLVKDLITKPIAGNAILTAAEKEGLKNLAVNTGLGVGSQVGIDTAQQLAGDQPFNWTRSGINAVGGFVMNEPTKFSQRRLGMKPSFEGVPTRQEILSQREGLASANRAPIGNELTPASPDYPERYNEPAYQINALAKGADDKYVVDDATINSIFGREYPKLAGASKIEGQGLVPNTKIEMTLQQKREFLDQVMRERTDTAEDFGTLLELDRQYPDYSNVRQSGSALEMMQAREEQARFEQQNKRKSGRGNISKYGSPRYQVETPVAPPIQPPVIGLNKSKGRQVDITQRQEYNGGKNRGPYKYSEETTPLAIDVSKQEIDAAVDEALKKRGMTIGTYGKPIVDSNGNPVLGRNTGNRIAGNVDTSRREMNISDKGGPDTAFHEVGHQQLMDLATSADPKDRELVGRIFAEHGKPEITAEKFLELNRGVEDAIAKGDTTTADAIREQFIAAEEEIVQYAGLESSSRKLEKKAFIPKAKQYIKDYASRLGMGDKPATQQLSARQEYEAPYGTRDVEAPRVETANTNKESEVPSRYESTEGINLWRGVRGKDVDPIKGRDGYIVTASSNKDVAQSYTDGDVHPVNVKGKIIEFPVKKSKDGAGNEFDRFAFDEAARRLGDNEILVARNVYDAGPISPKENKHLYLSSYPSDVYAVKSGSKAISKGHTQNTKQSEIPSKYGAPQENDYEAYLDVQRRISAKIKAGEFEGEEFKKLWQENEDIKNRNGGMPPKEPKEITESKKGGEVTNEKEIRQKEGLLKPKSEGEDTKPSSSKQSEVPSKQAKLKEAADDYKYYRERYRYLGELPIIGDPAWGKSTQADYDKWKKDATRFAEENRLKYKDDYELASEIRMTTENMLDSNLYQKAKDLGYGEDVDTMLSDIDRVMYDNTKQSEEPSKYKPKEDPNILPKKSLFSFTTSVSDKIVEGKESSPIHKKVSEALRNYFLDSDKNAGKYGQSIARLYSKYTSKDIDAHYKDRWERDNGIKKGTTLTGKALELDNAFQSLIEKPKIDAAAEGLKVKDGDEYRVGGIKKDGYLYNMFDPEILHKLDNEPTSIESKKAMRQWKEWLIKKGMDAPEAQESIDAYLRARRDYGDTGGPEFGAMRKAEGMGLPWELIDKNPARAALRYGKRAGNDLAYFKNLQKDPELLKALGLKDQFQKNPEGLEDVDYIGNEKNVQDAMKYVWGKNVNSNPRFAALMRVAGNLVMGHGTAIRNIAAIPAQMSVYDVKLKDVFNGLSKLSSTRERAYETGAVRVNTSEYEYLGDLGNPDPWVKNLDKMSEFLRKWQGRNMSDKFEGEFIYSVGEEWAKNMLAAKNMDMLKRASGKSDYSIPEKVTQSDIADLAAGFTRLVRGSYGPTGLPNWALTGNVAPFVALNRYGIEKWNNVNKDVIQPLKKGNIKPFLSYTLASLGTGAMIEEMNQLLSNKKGSDLNIKEAMAAWAETHDPEIASQKAIGLMQMASYAGIISDFAKMASRAAAGKEISYSNPVGMPLYTLATETFAENFGGMVGAIRDGEDPIGAISQFVKSFAVNTIQASRYAAGHIEKEETERKESFGDYRKYQEATGKSSREELKASKGNPYQDIDAKKFKKTDDLKEAASMVPELIQKAIKNANGDPYKLKAEFRKLKSNSFQTMPSPETQPTEFYEYVNYLNRTIGPEKTALRVQKFFTQRAVNKAKNTMVP